MASRIPTERPPPVAKTGRTTVMHLNSDNRRFWRIVAGLGISSLGDGLHEIAFVLLATTLTRDPSTIALVAMVSAVPALLFALPMGSLVDRLPRGRLLVSVDVVRATALGVLVLAMLAGELRLWHLFVTAFVLGVGEMLFGLSATAFLPDVLDEDDLPRANGYLSTVRELFNGVLGPAVAGVIFAFSASVPFVINGATFVVSALLIGRLAWSDTAPVEESDPSNPRGRLRDDIREGVVWLVRSRELRALALVIWGWNLFGWMPEATLVLYAKEELHMSGSGYGWLFGATSVGAVLGGLLAPRLIRALGVGGVLQLSIGTYSTLMVLPAFLGSPILVGATFFAQGIPLIAWSVVSTTVWQTLVPADLRGRVSSLFLVASAGMAPLGLLLGGLAAELFGLREVFVVSTIGLVGTWALSARGLTRLAAHLRALRAERDAARAAERVAPRRRSEPLRARA
jgi:MFS family permease